MKKDDGSYRVTSRRADDEHKTLAGRQSRCRLRKAGCGASQGWMIAAVEMATIKQCALMAPIDHVDKQVCKFLSGKPERCQIDWQSPPLAMCVC